MKVKVDMLNDSQVEYLAGYDGVRKLNTIKPCILYWSAEGLAHGVASIKVMAEIEIFAHTWFDGESSEIEGYTVRVIHPGPFDC